jgi:enoyl-CoA hydratase/carnithine racemase
MTSSQTTDRMQVRKSDAIGWMIFNNPKRHNALALDMWEAIPEIVAHFESDPEVRVIVLRGAGERAFISGADISQFESQRSSPESATNYNRLAGRANNSVLQAAKPTIAMIRGYCMGGGLGMALNCDLRIAAADSRFAIPAARLGVGYGHSGLRQLMDVVGPAYAKEIFYTARHFDAAEAERMGLVNRVVSVDELEATVLDYCRRIAENAPLTLRSVKVIVGELVKGPGADEDLCRRVVQDCFDSADYIEGRRAFMEKRRPDFKGK